MYTEAVEYYDFDPEGKYLIYKNKIIQLYQQQNVINCLNKQQTKSDTIATTSSNKEQSNQNECNQKQLTNHLIQDQCNVQTLPICES